MGDKKVVITSNGRGFDSEIGTEQKLIDGQHGCWRNSHCEDLNDNDLVCTGYMKKKEFTLNVRKYTLEGGPLEHLDFREFKLHFCAKKGTPLSCRDYSGSRHCRRLLQINKDFCNRDTKPSIKKTLSCWKTCNKCKSETTEESSEETYEYSDSDNQSSDSEDYGSGLSTTPKPECRDCRCKDKICYYGQCRKDLGDSKYKCYCWKPYIGEQCEI